MFPFFAESVGTVEVLAARRNRAGALAPIILLILAILALTSCAALPGQNTHQPSGFASETNTFRKEPWDPPGEFHPRARLTIWSDLPQGTVGKTYNGSIFAHGGVAPYKFLIAGTLPSGLVLDANTGIISGTPLTSGAQRFAVTAADFSGMVVGSKILSIEVAAGAAPIIGLEISPASTTVSSSGSVQFTARVSGISDVSVTWSATSGTISQDGWYAAPAGSALGTVTITAIRVADPTVRAVATVVVTPQSITSAPVITSTSLPSATTAVPYRATLTASAGTPPYQWTLSAGSLPQGFQLDNTTGIISGSSNSAGSFSFTIQPANLHCTETPCPLSFRARHSHAS